MSEHKKKRLVLFDAHAILHRAYHALPDFSTASGEPTGALYGISTMLIKIINELKPDYMAACYDLPEPTFRHEAYKGYKATRAKTDEALVAQIERSREVFKAFNIPIYDAAGFEADDILGTIATALKGDTDVEVVIASGDMDTVQLVDGEKVKVYTLRKGITDTVIYDEKKVFERFGFAPGLLPDFKGLMGDPSDNIIGVPGVGQKTATTLVVNFGTIENIYKTLKKDKEKLRAVGITPRIIKILEENEDEAKFSKELATIRHDAPIKFALPKKEWSEGFDQANAEALFKKFEFRSLSARLYGMHGGTPKEEEPAVEEEIDEGQVTRLAIALWLIDSENTSPTLEDIYEFSGERSLPKSEKYILGELKKKGLDRVYTEIELPLVSIVDRAQKRGIGVDVPYLKRLSKEYHKKLSTIESKIYKYAGGEFNINSPKQLGEVLFDKMELTAKGLKKTAGGARSTRESELQKLAGSHPIIKEILAYRELQKLLSTYIDNIPNMVGEDGRLHTTLNQTGTSTGRMSSSNPNLQNIPVRDGLGGRIRDAFVAKKGYTLMAFDYSQIEMRVLAMLSGDEVLTEVFREGKDVHASVASRVFGVKEDEVTPEMRRRAKVINFGIVYGMGVTALQQNLDSTRKEAQEFYNGYFEAFPKISAYFDKVKKDARNKGFTETMFGRRRYFEAINSHIPYVRAMAERMAMNAPIQGTAADLVKIAMKNVDEALTGAKLDTEVGLLLQVHDELIFEVKDDPKIKKKAEKLIIENMEHVIDEAVPLRVNLKQGLRWGSLS